MTKQQLMGVDLIAEERQRQVEQEGWTAEHDDGHSRGEMARAAACYAMPKSVREMPILHTSILEFVWHWEWSWWKPAETKAKRARIRELVKAGALIAAEIDRLQRIEGAYDA